MNSKDINKHIIKSSSSIRDAMNQLNDLGADGVLLIINNENQLIGSLTDGDIRRGLLNGVSIEKLVTQIYHSNPRFVRSEENNVSILKSYRNLDLKIVPVVNGENQITDIINFNKQFSFLPVDVVIMAGGKGTRLLPLTEELPKPLLCVGDQPIIDHLMNRLSFFGVKNIVVSVNHFGDQIIKHLKSKESNFNLKIITEKFPMGTIGSISLIDSFNNDDQTKILIATPQKAGEGLTLTVANHAIFYDRSFSLQHYLQAQDRIHRISQRRSCQIYNLYIENSIDEYIDKLVRAKHISSQLASGDISKSEFIEEGRFDLAKTLQEILS